MPTDVSLLGRVMVRLQKEQTHGISSRLIIHYSLLTGQATHSEATAHATRRAYLAKGTAS